MYLPRKRQELEEFLRSSGILAAKLNSTGELIFAESSVCTLTLQNVPCRFKDDLDGFSSFTLTVRTDFSQAEQQEIPAGLWKQQSLQKGRLQKHLTEDVLLTITCESLKSWISSSLYDLFAGYRLEEMKQFMTEDIQRILDLQFSGSLSGSAQPLRVEHMADLKFTSLDWEKDRERKEELEQLQHEHQLELEKNRKSTEIAQYRKRLELMQADLAEKQYELEQNKALGEEQLKQSRLETKAMDKQIEHLELKIQEAEQNIQLADAQRQNESSMAKLLKTLDANLQELSRGVAAMQQGQHASMDELLQALDQLGTRDQEKTATMNRVLEHVQKVYETIQTRSQSPAELAKAIYQVLQSERYDANPHLKQIVAGSLKQHFPEYRQDVQHASRQADALRFIRERILADQKAGRAVAAVSMLLKKNGGIISPIGNTYSSFRGVTYADDEAVKPGDKYKFLITPPETGYLWVFHVSRKIEDPLHLLYPFRGDIMGQRNPEAFRNKESSCLQAGKEIVFPDHCCGRSKFLIQTESTGENAYDRDAILILISREYLDIFSETPAPGYLPMDTNLGFFKGPSYEPAYVDISALKTLDPAAWMCGMVEYTAQD